MSIKLVNEKTLWFFLSGSDEQRFLEDINFGIFCLKQRGISIQNIKGFIDQPEGKGFVESHDFPPDFIIHELQPDKMITEASKEEYENLVIFVTGHGNEMGIVANPYIQPDPLLNTVRNIDGLNSCLITLGQCYAGVFNYTEARKKQNNGELIPPEICIAGATGFTSSISAHISLRKDWEWVANIFLLYFLNYIREPFDIDGDGKHTVSDAYKLASIKTNQELLELKGQIGTQMYQDVVRDMQDIVSKDDTYLEELLTKTKQSFYKSLGRLLDTQTPWILNANYARKLEL